MSNRKNAFAQPTANPSTRFMEWKSNDKSFSYWDKAAKKEVVQALPFKFLVLDELHTLGGWNDASSSRIFSNEVKYIGKQEMTVKAFKGGIIAKGVYTDIKNKVKDAKGHYLKSIYIMLEDGSLANVKLKGSAVKGWGEFTKANRSKLASNWVEINKAIEGKKGTVKFTTPDFTVGAVLTPNEESDADKCFDSLEAYLKTYLVQQDEPVVAEIEVEVEDLDF